MLKTDDNELISDILVRIVQLEPRQLIGVYDMLMSIESTRKGDFVVKTGPRNAEQLLVFLDLWKTSKIFKYDEFLIEVLAKIKFKRGRWYLDIVSKSHIEESNKIIQFTKDLKEDLELYIIHCSKYDDSEIRSKYL